VGEVLTHTLYSSIIPEHNPLAPSFFLRYNMVFFFSRLCNRLKTRKRGLKLKGATNGLISRWTYLAK